MKQPKFVFFMWTGPSANLKAKTAATQIKSSVAEYFKVRGMLRKRVQPLAARRPRFALRFVHVSPFISIRTLPPLQGVHTTFQFDSRDSITEAEIIKGLMAARGSHKPSRWEFGSGNPAEEEDDERDARLAEEARLRGIAEAEAQAAEEARQAEEARLAAEAAAKAEADRIAAEEAARIAAEEAARAEAARIAEEERQKKINMLPTYQTQMKKRFASNPDVQGYDFSALTENYVLEELGSVDSELA